jgi:hypothetical protein
METPFAPACNNDLRFSNTPRNKGAERERMQPLTEKARAAFEAIGIRIHEPNDDAPLLVRWKRAVA